MAKVIGIDLGNKNCVVGVSNGENIDIIENESCNRISPTMVTYTNERRFAGELAKQNQMEYCQSTITNLKYLIGLKYDSDERKQIEAIVAYKIVKLDDGYCGVSVPYKGNDIVLRPEQCITYLLNDLIQLAKTNSPDASKCVISVSPWWSHFHRRSLLNAVKIGNIDCLSLVNSTTAAAVSYIKVHEEKLPPVEAKPVPVMFIDVGDYSMNVVIALVKQHYLKIAAYAYDDHLGGALFTAELIPYLLARTMQKYKIDPRQNPRAWIKFQDAAEKLKKTLSINPSVPFEVPCLMNDIDVNFLVKREDFNARIQPLVSRVEDPILRALGYADLKKEDLYAVECLGGGARVLAVKEKIAEVLGKEPTQTLNIDECFAEGSVLLARKLAGDKVDFEVVDAAPNEISASFKTNDLEQRVILFKKFAPVPSETKFTVPVDGHLTVKIASTVCDIGTIDLNVTNGKADVEITLAISPSSYIQYKDAKVVENPDQHEVNVSFAFAGDLLDHQLQGYQKLENDMAAQDNLETKIDDLKNQLESTIFETENGINRDFPDFFDPAEINKIKKDVKDIHDWFSENEFERKPLEEYQTRLDTLKGYLEPAREKAQNYQNLRDEMLPLKDKANDLLVEVKTEPERIDGGEKEALQKDISDFIEEVDKRLAEPKHVVPQYAAKEYIDRYNSLVQRRDSLKKLPPKVPEKPPQQPTKVEHPDEQPTPQQQQQQQTGPQDNEIPSLEDLLDQFWYHPTFYRNQPPNRQPPKRPQQKRQQQPAPQPQPQPQPQPTKVEEPDEDKYYYDKYGHIIGIKEQPQQQQQQYVPPQPQEQPTQNLLEEEEELPEQETPPPPPPRNQPTQQPQQRPGAYVREPKAEDSEEEEYYDYIDPLSYLFGYPTRRPKQNRNRSAQSQKPQQQPQPQQKQQQTKQQNRPRRGPSPYDWYRYHPFFRQFYPYGYDDDQDPRRRQPEQEPEPVQEEIPTQPQVEEPVEEEPQVDYETPYAEWQSNHQKQLDDFQRRYREQEEEERRIAEKRRQLEEEERAYLEQKRLEEENYKRQIAAQQAARQQQQQQQVPPQQTYSRAGPGFDFWDPFYAPNYLRQLRKQQEQQQREQQERIRQQREQQERFRQQREEAERQRQQQRRKKQQRRAQQQQQQQDDFWGPRPQYQPRGFGGYPFFPFY